jgi:hypothetical protein
MAFLASPADQAAAPSSLLLGGMQEEENDVYGLLKAKPVAVDSVKNPAVEVTAVEVSA